MKLSNFTQGRDNNFNLIRIIAAAVVLITHSFALATGNPATEPLHDYLGMTLGSIAVDVFFITSGFLVTASLLIRQSSIEFIWARILRIFPGLFVMLMLTVFGLGAVLTRLPLTVYYSDPQTYQYLFKCLTLIGGVVYKLPGVFEHNPYQSAVNGSLWTMPYEVRMYGLLVLLWMALGLSQMRRVLFEWTVILVALVSGVMVMLNEFYFASEGMFIRLSFMFFSGASYYVLKEHLELTTALFGVFLLLVLTAAVLNKPIFFLSYHLTLAYILFYLAYIPSGFIRKYNSLGDYSYSIYIYGFPVQQSVVACIPHVSVLTLLCVSATITFVFAAISWHIIEHPALGLKKHYVQHTHKWLPFFQVARQKK